MGGRALPLVPDERRATGAAPDGDDLPELCPLAPHDGHAERRLRSPLQGGCVQGRPSPARSRNAEDSPAGQQQRVAVARALVVKPEILLLDEPLSNLDANLREEMRFEIRRLHEQFAITTLYVTHDQAEAMVISDRVAVLQEGRVAQIGTAEELFQRPRTRFVAEFIGRTNLIDGVAEGTGVVARGRLRLRVAAVDLTPGAPVAVSIRPHQIELASRALPGASAAPEANVLAGTVVRASYLGDGVAYHVQIDDSDVVLRVAGSAPPRGRLGEKVSATVAAGACATLPSGGGYPGVASAGSSSPWCSRDGWPSRGANSAYTAGRTRRVSAVDEIRPPMTTLASGFWISAPMPWLSAAGGRS